MRGFVYGVAALLSVTAFPSAALGQDQPRVGLTMGYPSAVGILVRATDAVAIRPEFSFSASSLSTDLEILPIEGLDLSTDQWSIGIGASALLYVGEADGFRPYVAPRYRFMRSDGETLSSTEHQVSGLFGVQYAVSPRVTIYGETGVAYTRRRATPDVAVIGTITGHGVALTSGVGLAVFF